MGDRVATDGGVLSEIDVGWCLLQAQPAPGPFPSHGQELLSSRSGQSLGGRVGEVSMGRGFQSTHISHTSGERDHTSWCGHLLDDLWVHTLRVDEGLRARGQSLHRAHRGPHPHHLLSASSPKASVLTAGEQGEDTDLFPSTEPTGGPALSPALPAAPPGQWQVSRMREAHHRTFGDSRATLLSALSPLGVV